MSAYTYSVVLICPAAMQAQANFLACALEHDTLPGNTFSVALSADGLEPATYYGCHTTAQQSFIDLFTGAAQGDLPPVAWEDYGLTIQDVAALLPALIFAPADLNERDGHFERVIAAQEPPLMTMVSEIT
jgi:hypothetical protein